MIFGTVAQLVEHEPFKLVVAGSSPARITILVLGPIAQLVRAADS